MHNPINVNNYHSSQFLNPKTEELQDDVKVNLNKYTLKQKLDTLSEFQK